MKISISIPTYNRLENVKQLAKSLSCANGTERHNIRIYDDASTEFVEDVLQKIFPKAEIKANKNNLGADINTYQICKDFLTTGDDILLICDSDLVLHPESLGFIEDNIKQTDGILSIFNSTTHQKNSDFSDKFILKSSVGAAGTAFTKELMSEIVDNVPEEQINFWDWAFCAYIKAKKKRIFVSRRSYVLHTGIEGENSNVMLFDFAKNYMPYDDIDMKIVDKLNNEFINRYLKMSDIKKVKILTRRIARESGRCAIKNIFGEGVLIKLLSWRKGLW